MENTRMDDKFNYEELNKEGRLVMVAAHEAELARIVATEMVKQGTLPESVLDNTEGSVMAKDPETGEVRFYLIGREAYEHEKMKYSNKAADV